MHSTIRKQASLKNKKFNYWNGFFQNNYTQIIIILITIIPTIFLISSTFISLLFLQNSSLQIIEDFAENIYQDQINISKLQNLALAFQLNQQVQKISWQINMLNEFLGSTLLGDVIKNDKYQPAIHNLDRTYFNDEDPIILGMYKRNPILTSVWHHVNKSRLDELDQRQMQQIIDGSRMDSIWKSIKLDNQNKNSTSLKIKDIYIAHEYDGLLYMTSMNTTFSTYPIPKDCHYIGKFRLDLRCRFYYPPTMENISTMLFQPKVLYSGENTYLGSTFCQRRLRYKYKDPNSESEKYSILCISLDLSEISSYFKNFGDDSKLQLFLDPRNLTVAYHSLIPLEKDQIASIQDFETNNLQDQNEAQKFLDNVSQMSQYILGSSDSVDILANYKDTQMTFEYNRNGSTCFVIKNLITMVDKVPRYETLKSKDPSKKFQLKNAFLFLDVLSKDKMTQYSTELKNTIKSQNIYFTYVSLGLIIFILCFQLYYSIKLGIYLLHPVIHLTKILKQIHIQNEKQQDLTGNNMKENSIQTDQIHQINSVPNLQSVFSEVSTDQENQILIDEHIDADSEGICFSSDTQILLNSFQNLFKILRFTTQNLFKENESVSLLNLNIQIQYFEKFRNNRALGVCHNNMGVIHFNCGRYQEAMEQFQKAIIYAKYELNIYSHDNEGIEVFKNISRCTLHLRSSLYSNRSQFESTYMGQTTGIYDRQKNKYNINNLPNNDLNCQLVINQENQERQQLYWNLYNRKENYLKSLSSYLQQKNGGLWDIFEDCAIENTSISQLYLPHSNKREMMNYFIILIGYFNQNLYYEASHILNKLSNLYIKNHETKISARHGQQQNMDKSKYNSQQVTNSKGQSFSKEFSIQESQFFQSRVSLNTNIINSDFNYQALLLSPFQKIKNKHIKKQQNHNTYIEQSCYKQSEIQLTNKQSDQSFSKQNDSQISKNDKFKDFRLDQNQQINKSDHQLQDNFQLIVSSSQTPQNLLNSELKLKKKTLDSSKRDNLSPSHSALNSRISLSPILKKDQCSQQQNLQNSKIINNINETLQKTVNNIKNSSLQIYNDFFRHNIAAIKGEEQKKGNQNKQNKQSIDFKITGTQSNKNSFRVSNARTNSKRTSKKKQSHTIKLSNKYPQSLKWKKYQVFYQVRKLKKKDKLSQYEFSSDIFFHYYALQQAQYQIKLQNYRNAALLLTNVLEQCEYYLPHLKKLVLNKLLQVFKMKNIKSVELEEMTNKYTQLTYCNFHICVISACHSNFYQKRAFALSNDLVNEILFKEYDSFGLIQYSFEEHIYLQSMLLTPIKTINSDKFYFDNILHSLYNKNISNKKNEGRSVYAQQDNVSNYQHNDQNSKQISGIDIKNSQRLDQSYSQQDYKEVSFFKDNSIINFNQQYKNPSLNVQDQNLENKINLLKKISNSQTINELLNETRNDSLQQSFINRSQINGNISNMSSKRFLQLPNIENLGKPKYNQVNNSMRSLSSSSSSSVESVFESDRIQEKKVLQSLQDSNKNSSNQLDVTINQNIDNDKQQKCNSFKELFILKKNSSERNEMESLNYFKGQYGQFNSSRSFNKNSQHASVIQNYTFTAKMIPLQKDNQINLENNDQKKFSSPHKEDQDDLRIKELSQQNVQSPPKKYSYIASMSDSNCNSSSNILSRNQQDNSSSPTQSFVNNNLSRNSSYQETSPLRLQNQRNSQQKQSNNKNEQFLFTIQSNSSLQIINSQKHLKNIQPLGDTNLDNLDNSLCNQQNSIVPISKDNGSQSPIRRRLDSSFLPKYHKDSQCSIQQNQKEEQKSSQIFLNNGSFSFINKECNANNNNNQNSQQIQNNSFFNSNKQQSSKSLQNDQSMSNNSNDKQQLNNITFDKKCNISNEKFFQNQNLSQNNKLNQDQIFKNGQNCSQQVEKVFDLSQNYKHQENKIQNQFLKSQEVDKQQIYKRQQIQHNTDKISDIPNIIINDNIFSIYNRTFDHHNNQSQSPKFQVSNIPQKEFNPIELTSPPNLIKLVSSSKKQKLEDQKNKKKNINFAMTSEQVFHQGIQAALKHFILNTDEKISCYLSQKNYNENNNSSSSNNNKDNNSRIFKQNQTYLVYITDQQLKFNNQPLLDKLCELICNLDIELLVLVMNQKYSLEEYSDLQNIFLNEKSVISFFSSEQKLLQYIYNHREHVKNYLIPMIFEHF